MVPIISVPDEIRRIIYTINTIESLNNTLKKKIESRASFPMDEPTVKRFYLSLQKHSEKVDYAGQKRGQYYNPACYPLLRSDALLKMYSVI